MKEPCFIASPGPRPLDAPASGGRALTKECAHLNGWSAQFKWQTRLAGLTHRHRLAARFLVASLLAVIGAGCAAPVATTTPAASPSAVVSQVPSPVPATTQSLEIKQFAYSPATIEVASGTVVEWKNTDSIIHSVTSGTPDQPGGAFDSGLFDEGQTFTTTLTQPGTYPYFCTRHQFMRGELRVSG